MDYNQIFEAINGFMKSSPLNTVEEMGNLQLFDLPLIGIAGVTDPFFGRMKKADVVGPRHLSPHEWLIDAKVVISYFLPFTATVREANRELGLPANEWLYARIEGEKFNNAMRQFLVDYISAAGYKTIAPALDKRYSVVNRISNWSERHVAFIAGLGTFSLNRSLITKLGSAGRFGSVVTELELEPTQRYYSDFEENCTRCGQCILRCPPRAIDANGKDNAVCSEYLDEMLNRYRPRYGCGKCQTNLPCEDRIPEKVI